MKVSLVIPAHNEEENLVPLIEEIIPVLEKHPQTSDYEILLVDDNSTDQTPTIIDTITQGNPRIISLHRTQQPGFGSAMKAGFSASSGEIIIPVMGDLSDNPEDIPKLVEKIEEGYDIAYGSRFIEGGSLSEYPRNKLVANRIFNNLVRLLFGIPHKDITNAFKAYRREVIDGIGIQNLESEGFDLTLEIPIKGYIEGFRSIEVPVHWVNRKAGVAKLKLSQNASVYGKRLFKLFFIGNLVSLKDLSRSIFKGSWIGIVFGLLIGIAILAFLFSFYGVSEIITLLGGIALEWFFLSCLAILLSFVFRTWRWGVILRSSGFVQPREILFKCIMFGWLVNYLLPLRVGDIARAVSLKTTRNAPFGMTLSTIIVERIYDLVTLGILLTVSVYLVSAQNDLHMIVMAALIISLSLLAALLIVYYFDTAITRIFEKRIPSIRESIHILKQGLLSMATDRPAIALSFILSFPVWLMEIGSVYFASFALAQPIRFTYATISGIAAFIAQSIPLTPGGIGIHEASITAILILFGISPQVGLSIALVDHAACTIVIFIFGIPAAIHIGFESRNYFRRLRSEKVATNRNDH